MDAQQLKNSILQMAVQGKLVPQDPNDEPASVLLERIRKEKEKLIKEGKIKKEKNPSYIFRGADNTPYEKVGNKEPVSIADEMPFDIPESWEWVRLQTVCTKLVDGDHNPPKGESNRTKYIMASSTNINQDRLVDLEKVRYLSAETFLKENERTSATVGDIFFTSVGSLGRSCIYDGSLNICFQRSVSVITTLLFNEYLKYCFDSGYFQNKVQKEATGTAQKGFYLNQLASALIPVPPFDEQVRIVLEIKKYLPLITQYEKKQTALSELNDNFPEQLKKSILQLAVQGKLVPQDPNDEPASVLMERIRTEKERLIKEGKIKRNKNESVIFRRDNSHYEKLGSKERCIDDEIPFELPDSWIWARLGTLISLLSGQDFDPSGYNTSERGIPYITGASNIEDGKVIINRWTEVPKNIAHSDELLLVCKGAGVGKMAVLKEESVHIARQIMSILPIDTNVHYLEVVLKYNLEHLRQSMQGVIPGISRSDVLGLLCPVPPLSEQERIVKQLKMILTMVNPL